MKLQSFIVYFQTFKRNVYKLINVTRHIWILEKIYKVSDSDFPYNYRNSLMIIRLVSNTLSRHNILMI